MRSQRPTVAVGIVIIASLVAAIPAECRAQIPLRIEGRVVDAADGSPILGATVLAADSSAATLTGTAGQFSLELADADQSTLVVRRIGYVEQRFALPAGATRRPLVLTLEPAAIEILGVTAEVETQRAILENNLQERRQSFAGSVKALDREWLDRFAPVGSALDLVRDQMPRSGPCNADRTQLCVPGRNRSLRTPYPSRMLTVCIDGWKSISAIGELSSIDLKSISLIEIYGSAGVKIYTDAWFHSRSESGRLTVFPDTPFGLSCQ